MRDALEAGALFKHGTDEPFTDRGAVCPERLVCLIDKVNEVLAVCVHRLKLRHSTGSRRNASALSRQLRRQAEHELLGIRRNRNKKVGALEAPINDRMQVFWRKVDRIGVSGERFRPLAPLTETSNC